MVYIFGVYSVLYMVFIFDMVRLRKKNKVTIHHTKVLKREERKMNFRIYGKTIETWTHIDERGRERITQYEIEYKEYDENGELVGIGSEDFSTDRYHKTLLTKMVYTWDGAKRNKGNYRWFECCGFVTYNRKYVKAVKAYLANKYNAELVELR